MISFLVNRLIGAVVLVLFITFFTFGVMKISGDPLADLKLNPAISQARIEAEKKRLGLNESFSKQYFIWLGNVLQGDFGYSQNNQKVTELIKPALINTLILNLLALFLTWTLAIPLGVIAAIKKNTWIDNGLQVIASILMSVPSFVLAIFALLFALKTGWFPIGGLTSSYYDELDLVGKFFDLAKHLCLPVFILVAGGFIGIQRQMRANLLDVMQENYIKSAQAKGLKGSVVFLKHALRNAINPLITILGYEFSGLFAGSGLTEMVLAYPGLGYLTLEAARKLDVNVVLANLLLGSIMLVLGNLLADLLLLWADPKLKSKQIL